MFNGICSIVPTDPIIGGFPVIHGESYENKNSLLFDGFDESLTVDAPYNLAFTDAFTISFWHRPGSLTNYCSVISNAFYQGTYPSGANVGWNFMFNNFWHFYMYGSGWNDYMYIRTNSASYNNQKDGWHHMVVTYNGNSPASGSMTNSPDLKLYMDSVHQSTGYGYNQNNGTGSTSPNTRFRIADIHTNQQGGGGTRYNGYLDEISIFDRVLTQSEISEMYNGTPPTGGGSGAPWNDGTGSPTNLKKLNPILWFRMGEKATWDGSKFTIPNEGSDTSLPEIYSSNLEESDLTTVVAP